MPAFWLPIAVAGSGIAGTAGNLLTGFMGQGAAKQAAASQESMFYNQLLSQQRTRDLMLSYFDPFRQIGLQAGRALQGELYSPEQQTQTLQTSLDETNRQLQALQQQRQRMAATGEGVPVLTGKNASERRADVWNQMLGDLDKQIADLKSKASTTQSQLQYAQQNAGKTQAELITGNPMFTAGQAAIERRLAAQGLQGSQEAIRQEGTLAANVYNNTIQNQMGLYQPTIGATAGMANALGQTGMQQAQTYGQIGNTQASGIMGANQSITGGITGALNSLTGAGSSLLNYSMFNKMMSNLNTGSTGPDPVMGTGYGRATVSPTDYNSNLSYLRQPSGMGS